MKKVLVSFAFLSVVVFAGGAAAWGVKVKVPEVKIDEKTGDNIRKNVAGGGAAYLGCEAGAAAGASAGPYGAAAGCGVGAAAANKEAEDHMHNNK